MTKMTIVFLAALLAGAVTATATTYTFTTINPPPGVPDVVPFGINNAGQIVGYEGLSVSSTAFLYSGGVFTSFSVPGATATVATGINNSGQIVGNFTNSSGGGAFLDNAGAFSTISVPFGLGGGKASGINDHGQIVGTFSSNPQISGYAIGGFLDSSGSFSSILSGNFYTQPGAINNSGEIVGSVGNPLSGSQPFVYQAGVLTIISVPNVPSTGIDIGATGVNDAGQIIIDVGTADNMAFLDDHGVFSPIIFPGSIANDVYGINDAGQIVGTYVDSSFQTHAFLATPSAAPELSSWIMMAFGALGLWLFTRRRLRAA
jgi:probable HAF family extracellular repeat protein